MTRNALLQIALVAVWFLAHHARAADLSSERPDFVETPAVDGVVIGVTDEMGSTNTPPNRGLCFSVWTTNGPARVRFPIQPEYCYQVELFDEKGASIPKTAAGRKVGARFFEVDENAYEKGIRTHLSMADKKAWPCEMLLMFRPDDLFKIEAPGRYRLQIRFQLVLSWKTGAPGASRVRLIRFPPVEYPIAFR